MDRASPGVFTGMFFRGCHAGPTVLPREPVCLPLHQDRDRMKTFHCDVCGNLVFFENVSCLNCGHALGFLPELLDLSSITRTEGDDFLALAPAAQGAHYRACANGRVHGVCNWMVPAESGDSFCVACRLNEVIPDLSVEANPSRWQRLELAKRRLIYTLLKLHLPLDGVPAENRPALRFRFMQDETSKAYLTGHEAGLITINIAEADDDVREQRRVSLHEPFRTLLGHFRHEVAHYYWERLIAHSHWENRFRELFGDESADYAAALEQHYRLGPLPAWADRSVSAYASSHPWEDWAETTAHYFHITDTIETAASFGLSLRPQHPAARLMTADLSGGSRSDAKFDEMLDTWFPLTYALNSLNRGMGLPDLYPFVLSPTAIRKLRFVHDVLEGAGSADAGRAGVGVVCDTGERCVAGRALTVIPFSGADCSLRAPYNEGV